MARRIRWQILIASVVSLVVLSLMGYLALTTAAVARPLAGGAYTEALAVAPRQLNPLLSDPNTDQSAADIQALLFNGLMKIGADGLPEPALAADWPEIDPTGTEYTFRLRPDVRWHDGEPLTADDVIFTLRAVQGPNFFGDPTIRSLWQNIAVDKVDDLTVRCVLAAPYAPFLSRATFPILPAHLLRDVPPEAWGSGAFAQKPVGTGPYALNELTAEGASFTANRGYFGGQPLLDTLSLRFATSTQDAVTDLARGDVGGVSAQSSEFPQQPALPPTVRTYTAPLDSYTVLTFNLRQAPLSDQGLRRALATALDKDAIIAGPLAGQAQRIDTPLLPQLWAADPTVRWYPADGLAAADLLTSLGYEPGADGTRSRDGLPLAFDLITDTSPERVAVAEEIARQWAALGIGVQVSQLEPAALLERLEAHDFTLALHGWRRLGPDPDMLEFWHSSRAEDGLNYAGLADDEIDTLLSTGREDDEPGARAAAYAAFQRRWIDLAPSIVLYQPLMTYAVTEELDGLGFDAALRAGEGDTEAPPLLLVGREDRFRNITGWFTRSEREIGGDLRRER